MPSLGRQDVPAPRAPQDPLVLQAQRERMQRRPQRGRRAAVWDDPPAEPMAIPAAAERMGVSLRFLRGLVYRGGVRTWPVAVGQRLGLLPAAWPRGEEWAVDWAELAVTRTSQGERARVAAAPADSDPGVRYFLAVGPLVVHPAAECSGRCAVHAPSGHPLRGATLRWWRQPVVAVARQCAHNMQHADPDGIAGQVPPGVCRGDCCGCCR